MSWPVSFLIHAGALGALALGFWAWDAQGAAIWRDAVFSMCF